MTEIAKNETTLKPRPYQDHLIRVCTEKNTIVYLPTGAGKTFIPLMVFKRFSSDYQRSLSNGGRRSVFLASTRVLAKQQKEYFEANTPFKVVVFTGDMSVDHWGRMRWRTEFENNHIIVATYQIVLDILRHSFMELKNFNVMVIDECHNANKDHAIVQLMQRFVGVPVEDQPRIIGLTGMLLTSDRLDTLSDDLNNFEMIMRSTVATVATIEDYNNVLVYSTKPNEKIITYTNGDTSGKMAIIEKLVDKIKQEINEFHLEAETKRMSDMEGEKGGTKKKLLNYWSDFLYQAYDFGLYGASLAILGLIVELDLKKRASLTAGKRLLYRASITHAEMLRRILVSFMGNDDIPVHELIMKHSSDKLRTLLNSLECLLAMFEGEKINCLVFVERRFTSKCLFHILRNYADSKEDFDIRPEYLAGDSGYNAPELELMLQNKWNRQVIRKFKTNEVNLIVSTSVLEEGVDLQMCNLVVNYDAPKNFRSYLQRKGRARSTDSVYLLMVEHGEKVKLMGKIQHYNLVDKKMKEMLVGKCVDREIPSVDEIDREMTKDKKTFKTEKGAVLEEASAIALLNRYCANLPQDNFTISTPDLRLETIGGKYRIALTMPSQSTVKETIYSDCEKSKKLAKRSVAFKACIQLYQKGELSENLLPINKTMNIIKMQDVYFKHWQKYKKVSCKLDGTKKKKRDYQVQYPEQLQGCEPKAGVLCLLYIIHTSGQLNETCGENGFDENIATFNRLFQDSGSYAILTTKKLPRLAKMNFFLSDGQVTVKISETPVEVRVTEEELWELRKFHIVVFRDILRTVKTFHCMDYTNEKNSILIVPTVNCQIDMELVRTYQELQPVQKLSEMQRMGMKFNPEEYLHRVISPWYRHDDQAQRYVVTKVHHHLTPNSPFPDPLKAKSYAQYFTDNYPDEVSNLVNMNQFLIEVKGITRNLNLLNPGMSESGSKKQSRRFTSEILIPELCHNFTFPGSMWLKALVLPNVLHRLHYMLHAENIRMMIDAYLGVKSSTQLDDLVVDRMKFDVPKETVPSKSNFGPMDDSVVKVEDQVNDTFADILDTIFDEHKQPVDVHRNWDTIYPLDLEYYFYFLSLTDEFEKAKKRNNVVNVFNDNSVELGALAICGIPYAEEFNINLINVDEMNWAMEGPQQKDVLCAITAAKSHDVFDMERYEVLGDAFLKFTTSLYLLQKHKDWHEGFLTSCKGQVVGNRNLYYCGREIGLEGVVNVSPFCVSDFTVPHMSVPQEIAAVVQELKLEPKAIINLMCSEWEVLNGRVDLAKESQVLEIFAHQEEAQPGKSYPMSIHFGIQNVSDKTVSDAVEAILGVWVSACGIQKSFKLLNFLGILPKDIDMENLLKNQRMEPRVSTTITNDDINSFLMNPREVEQRLGYEFKDRAYLLQALTHPSCPTNKLTGCYQTLEFLGDAVLDIIITSYIFEHCKDMDPGRMTDLRSALVNNITLACVCVRNKFHLHILNQSPALTEKAAEFARYQQMNQHKISEHVMLLKEEDGDIMTDSVDVPKTLGDIMEALLGAVFLDSGNDMNAVWRVIVHLMGEEIRDFTTNVPINVVRQLYEWPGAAPEFSDASVNPENDTTMVTVRFVCCNKYAEAHGFGSNKLNAKRAAAKGALQYLRKNR